jgi:lipid-binding SYLF domain-containing protein
VTYDKAGINFAALHRVKQRFHESHHVRLAGFHGQGEGSQQSRGIYLKHKVYLALPVSWDFPFNLPANCSYILAGLVCNGRLNFPAHKGRCPVQLPNSLTSKSLAALTSLFLLLSTIAWSTQDTSSATAHKSATDDKSDIEKRLQASAEVLDEIMKAPDKGIPQEILDSAKCIAVVPSMVKFAIGFGGHYGKGVATCRTSNRTWSAPAPILLTGGSWGLQFGGQAVDLVMVIMNQKGMDHLLSSKFKIGADAAAAAGPVGRHAEAATDWKMQTEILTYSRARGIFAGVDLSGSVIKQDRDETRVLYGKMVPFSEILHGAVPAPKAAEEFLAALEKYTSKTRARGKRTHPKAGILKAASVTAHISTYQVREVQRTSSRILTDASK